MEKRTILAIALSVLVFIAFQWYQERYMKPAVVPQAPQTSTQTPSPAPIESPKQAEVQPAAMAAAAAQTPGDTAATPRKLVIDGDRYRAVIDNRGGVLTEWKLLDYKSGQGRTFEMIAASHDTGVPSFPSTLLFQDAAATNLANNELYEVTVADQAGSGSELRAPVTVVLKLRRGGLSIEKRYQFKKDNYLVDMSVKAEKGGRSLDGRFLLGQDIGPEYEHLQSSTKIEAVYATGTKVKRESPPKDPNEISKIGSDIRWAGLGMQYFAIIAIPSQPLPYFDIQKRPIKTRAMDGSETDRDLLRVTLPMQGSLDCQLYLGPKKQADLKAVKSADITGVIDYGMFTILVLPLLSSLRWMYQFVHNYGYAIIILTFVLSLLLFPFRLKQMISMKKMQVVQPKVKAIQEKYRRYKKTDPKRAEMNQEIMALYKEHNVNPLGGCIPLLLQFPLLLAFYSLLANSIELRQAPFIWWMHDLSVKDPYYVLPIVMGITMFISQKMTPMTPGTDPTQAKMMMIMPVVFTFMFFNVSSGLNLYFLCSNIFQVAFQKIAERWMNGRTDDAAKS